MSSSAPSTIAAEATSGLQQQLLTAHRNNNSHRLCELYADAADLEQARGDVDAMCFYLTQAYVHSLQADHPASEALRARLARHGRI